MVIISIIILFILLKQPIVLKYLGRRLRKQMNEVCKNKIFLINRLKIQGYSSITIDHFPQVYELEYPTTKFQILQLQNREKIKVSTKWNIVFLGSKNLY